MSNEAKVPKFKARPDSGDAKYAGGVMPKREFASAAEHSQLNMLKRRMLQQKMDDDLSRPLTQQETELASRVKDCEKRGLLRITAFTGGLDPPENGIVCDEVKAIVRELLDVTKKSAVGIVPRALPYVTYRMSMACAFGADDPSSAAASK